eukprot:1352444-Amphidinium_carterae.1
MRIGPRGPFEGLIYVDGSAIFPRCRDLRRAGFSLVQVDEQGNTIRAAFGPVPHQWAGDQTARDAEDCAVLWLAKLCGTQPLVIHTDCAGTFGMGSKGRRSKSQMASQRRAHFWLPLWQLQVDIKFVKVKAHRSEAECTEPLQHRHWKGNATADDLAKAGAWQHYGGDRVTPQRAEETLQCLQKLVQYVGEQQKELMMGTLVDHDPLPDKKSREVWGRTSGRRGGKNRRSTWMPPQWLRDMADAAPLAQRAVERVRVEPTGTSVLTGSLPYKVLQHVGDGHELMQFSVLQKDGHPVDELVACARCGAFAASKAMHLTRPCQGLPRSGDRPGLRAQRKRMQMGRHPSQRGQMAGLEIRLVRNWSPNELRLECRNRLGLKPDEITHYTCL